MTNDEKIVQDILDNLNRLRTESEQAEYDFFFRAGPDVQEMYYRYWLKNKDINSAPGYLVDYEESKKYD